MLQIYKQLRIIQVNTYFLLVCLCYSFFFCDIVVTTLPHAQASSEEQLRSPKRPPEFEDAPLPIAKLPRLEPVAGGLPYVKVVCNSTYGDFYYLDGLRVQCASPCCQ
jgi:hypothetical protein